MNNIKRIRMRAIALAVVAALALSAQVVAADDDAATASPMPFEEIIATVTTDAVVSQRLPIMRDGGHSALANAGLELRIADEIEYNDVTYYKAAYLSQWFFIPASDVEMKPDEAKKLKKLLAAPIGQRERWADYTLEYEAQRPQREREAKLTELRAFKKHGIAVADWGVSSADFFSRAAGIWFSVFNPTDKVIAGIVIDVIGYDYGGKKIATRAGETVTLTSERRIAPDGTARLQFGRIWNADRLSRVEIKEITVTYDDGTTRRVKNIDKVTVPEELGNYFNLRGNGRDTMFDPFGW